MKTKRILSIILTLFLLLSAVPIAALPASAAVTHDISLAECHNGTLTFEKTTAAEGETVTFTAKPDEGYDVCVIKYEYTSAAGISTSVCLENGVNGVYEFVVPECRSASNRITFHAFFHPKDEWITFTSTESFTLKTANGDFRWYGIIAYSTDESDWKVWEGSEITAAQVNGTGDYHLYLWGYGNEFITGNNNGYNWVLTPTGTNKISCKGNIETLRDALNEKSEAVTKMGNGCYRYLFSGCTALTTVPELPATSLAQACYYGMFSGCTALTTAPELPATSLAQSCYYGMFSGCTALTTAPELPATTLEFRCYQSMFSGCTSLTTAPELKATELGQYCYYDMFSDCTSLTTAPELKADKLTRCCYASMFSGCTALTTAPELKATSLGQYCYQSMFSGCTALTTAPELPATSLAKNCYKDMFKNCTHLYVKDGTADDYTWSIPTSTVSNPVTDMSTGCFDGSETVALPTTGTNYYKVVGVYDITNGTAETANGSVTIDKTTTFAGDTVTVTVTPAENYMLDTLTYIGEGDTQATTITATDGVYSFTMHSKAVTVTATFKKVHEHSYDAEPEYNWSDDGSTCTGTIACTVEGCTAKISEDATVTCTVKEAATCRAMGTTTYCATFKDTKFSTQYKDVTDIDINHDNHTGGTEVRDGVTATCETEGYTGDTYCLGCGEKIADGTETPKDSANHTGTTEIRNAASANCVTDGYTGDTYCVGCGVKIADGEVIPATGEHTDLDGNKACDVCGFDMHTEHLTIWQQIKLFFKSVVKAFAVIAIPFMTIGK